MKTVDDYMRLPYHITMVRDEGGGDPAYVVWVEELKGCVSQGDTAAEATEMIDEAMRLWIEVQIEEGWDVPLPREDPEYSGKLMLRLPRTLHGELAEGARHDGVSLNQYISTLLAGAIGWKQPQPAAKKPARRAKATA